MLQNGLPNAPDTLKAPESASKHSGHLGCSGINFRTLRIPWMLRNGPLNSPDALDQASKHSELPGRSGMGLKKHSGHLGCSGMDFPILQIPWKLWKGLPNAPDTRDAPESASKYSGHLRCSGMDFRTLRIPWTLRNGLLNSLDALDQAS